MNSNKYKEEGNRLFIKRNYKEAIEQYSKAIEKSPNTCIYYTNRALCNLKLKQWTNVVDDCRRAIELDNHSIKAYFYLGQALFELEQYDDAIVYLKRSHDLTKILNENYGDEITRTIRNVKRTRWNKLEEKRVQQEIDLQTYLQKLMYEDKMRRIDETKGRFFRNKTIIIDNEEKRETAENVEENGEEDKGQRKHIECEMQTSSSFESVSTSINQLDTIDLDENTKECINDINLDYEKRLSDLNRLFEENDVRRRKREIPDYLCGKISFELMTDPVITPSGITYDRTDIEQHLQRVGHFDPITRQELTVDQLITNLSMKEVIENFVAENPWIDGAL